MYRHNPIKTGVYHVKFIYTYNKKKYIFSVDNIEATNILQAKIIAGDIIQKNTTAEIKIILKRKKSNHE